MMPPCMLCNDQVKRNEFEPRLAFQFTPQQLEFAAYLENCESCLVILEGLRQSEPRGWSFKRDVKLVDATCRGRRGGFEDTLKLEIFFNDDRPKLELEYYNLQPHAFRGILPRNKTSGHPQSQQAMDWINNALVRCRNEHRSCVKPTQPLLPKRLVELGTTFYGATTIRLIETTHEQGEYVALSHCWGKEQSCITTTANLTGRKKGIQWSSIPKTFQEAMKLTQQLGFKYIWIDSLCIIQDDDADWETQSARMWEIYQDAVLTLAATSSAGDNEGCCSRNDRLPDLELDHLPDTIGTYRIAVRQPHNHWDVGTSHARKKHFPLLTRGWAFQERLLSPRVLHIGESELIWECREWSQCECGGLSQQRSPGGDYYHAVEENEEEKRVHDIAQQQRLDLEARMNELHIQSQQRQDVLPSYEDAVLAQETMPGPPSPTSDIEVDPIAFLSQTNIPIYEDNTTTNDLLNLKDCPNLVFHFHRVVESYSALDLTRPSDRLPALSGLCKRVQHIRNNYLAGLWSDSICFDLLWRVETIRLSTPTNGARPDEYRGPTWSWISVDSPVKYWDDIINFRDAYTGFHPNIYRAAGQHADQIEMSVTVPGQNPFGAVTSAVIKLRASATTATLRYTQFQDSHRHDEKGRVLSSGSHDPVRYKLELLTVPWWAADEWDADGRPASPSQQPVPIPVEIPFWPDYSLSAEGASMVPADTKVTLLLVHPKVCLVLRPKKGKKWERIGIAKISEMMLNLYKIDWMRESEVLKFRIV